MKKIVELKRQRAAKIEAMQALTTKVEGEKRHKNDEERVEWNGLKTDIEALGSEIEDLEYQERQAKNLGGFEKGSDSSKKDQEQARKYDLTKAVRGFLGGNLDGYEAEMHQEGAEQMRMHGRTAAGLVIPDQIKRSFTVATNANHIEKIQNFSNAAVEGGILDRLGITVFNNATASIGLNFSAGTNAGIYAEGADVPESTHTEKTGTLSAKRVQGWKNFSRSYLSQTATTADFLLQMESALQKAVTEDLIKKIVGDPALTLAGRTGTDTAAALTWKDVLKLKAALGIDEVVNGRYVSAKELFYEMQAIAKDAGSGRFLQELGLIAGDPSVNGGTKVATKAEITGTSPEPAKYKLIYGDFKEAYVAYFSGATEVLIDPYTASNTGKVKITFLRMGDTAINPYAFRSIQNIKI